MTVALLVGPLISIPLAYFAVDAVTTAAAACVAMSAGGRFANAVVTFPVIALFSYVAFVSAALIVPTRHAWLGLLVGLTAAVSVCVAWLLVTVPAIPGGAQCSPGLVPNG